MYSERNSLCLTVSLIPKIFLNHNIIKCLKCCKRLVVDIQIAHPKTFGNDEWWKYNFFPHFSFNIPKLIWHPQAQISQICWVSGTAQIRWLEKYISLFQMWPQQCSIVIWKLVIRDGSQNIEQYATKIWIMWITLACFETFW